MELTELKKKMTLLEHVLAKTKEEIKIDVTTSETAQTKLAKVYIQNARNCLLVSLIPVILLTGWSDTESFPIYLKIFLLIYLLLGAGWYVFLWEVIKKIDIITLTPISLLSATSRLRLYTLAGEIFFIVGLTVFFSLFLSNLWNYNTMIFWLIIGFLLLGMIFTLTSYIPKLITIFRELESIKY